MTPEEKRFGWICIGAGIVVSTIGTYGLSGLFTAMVYCGGTIITVAGAAMGFSSMRSNTGGRG